MSRKQATLFEQLGGLPTLQHVHKCFYDKVDTHLIARCLRIDHAFWKQLRNDSLDVFRQINLKYEQPLVIASPDRSGPAR